jgi:hypothetical protein
LIDTQSGSRRTTLTDAAGRFEFSNLPASQYELAAELTAFSPVSIAIPLAPATGVHHTLMLPLGTVKEELTVTCSGGPVTLAASLARLWRSIGNGILPALAAQERIRVGGSVREPRKIKDVKPGCPAPPPIGVQKEIALTGTIGVDGSVVFLEDAEDFTADLRPFAEASLAAVREWRFTPTLLNGDPVEVGITVRVIFTRP